jgi:glutamyl-tRNA synthetase
MHLGSVRVAALNYLFAKQTKGVFVLRIEDTDASRNMDEAKLRIIEDMNWLGLHYQEGPIKGGPYGPYAQSERTAIYQEQLQELINSCKVYRCFCTAEELEARRQKQIAMGRPPRYDRTCLHYSDDKIKLKLAAGLPFIWRFNINDQQVIDIKDLAHGTITFEMKNFGDFALTRPDGSFTFMFSNFVDDWQMKITHVIRGEDHLTNTAMQAAMYDAFAVPLPIFWHLPIICNKEGVKLSKRDFGFSLDDLRKAGFIPEAILNYLAAAGVSLTEEIQSLEQLANAYDFSNLHATGAIRYDVDKLTWFNHKWIDRLPLPILLERAKPFLHEAYPQSASMTDEQLSFLLSKIKTDLRTLADVQKALAFYFSQPVIDRNELEKAIGNEHATAAVAIITSQIGLLDQREQFIQAIKTEATQQGLKTKEIFGSLRFLLTGRMEGVGIHDLLELLPSGTIKQRLTLK